MAITTTHPNAETATQSAMPTEEPDRDMALEYSRAAAGGWNVHPAGRTDVVLGRVFQYRAGRGWWTEMDGEGVMQTDSKTRAAAARRIPACLYTRWLMVLENAPAPTPAGFELVECEQLGEGDEVMTPGRIRPDGVVKEWRGPVRTVHSVELPTSATGAPVVRFAVDAVQSNAWPWIGGGNHNRLARRVKAPLARPCGACGAEPGERCFWTCTARL
jgi:hypothetical protein